MADSETQPPVDMPQKVTSTPPTTRQKKTKRVAAGKAIAAKTKKAREEKEKALAEAQIIITKNKLKEAAPPVADTPVESESTKNVLTTTQWLSCMSILVSLVGIYYKQEEIKSFFSKKQPQNPPPQAPLPSPLAPPPSPVDSAPKRKKSISQMD